MRKLRHKICKPFICHRASKRRSLDLNPWCSFLESPFFESCVQGRWTLSWKLICFRHRNGMDRITFWKGHRERHGERLEEERPAGGLWHDVGGSDKSLEHTGDRRHHQKWIDSKGIKQVESAGLWLMGFSCWMKRWNLSYLWGKWISPFIKRLRLGERRLKQFSVISTELPGKPWVWLHLPGAVYGVWGLWREPWGLQTLKR